MPSCRHPLRTQRISTHTPVGSICYTYHIFESPFHRARWCHYVRQQTFVAWFLLALKLSLSRMQQVLQGFASWYRTIASEQLLHCAKGCIVIYACLQWSSWLCAVIKVPAVLFTDENFEVLFVHCSVRICIPKYDRSSVTSPFLASLYQCRKTNFMPSCSMKLRLLPSHW